MYAQGISEHFFWSGGWSTAAKNGGRCHKVRSASICEAACTSCLSCFVKIVQGIARADCRGLTELSGDLLPCQLASMPNKYKRNAKVTRLLLLTYRALALAYIYCAPSRSSFTCIFDMAISFVSDSTKKKQHSHNLAMCKTVQTMFRIISWHRSMFHSAPFFHRCVKYKTQMLAPYNDRCAKTKCKNRRKRSMQSSGALPRCGQDPVYS